MIEFLEDFLVTQRLLISIILLSLITAVIIMKYWDRVKFWWTCTWYSFPVIGKISKLSKDITSRDGNWFSSETTLCSDFYRYYNFKGANPEHYDICKDYLKKIDETGRKPFPLIMWIVVFALVILEALGFAYVLAGFTIPGASESLQQYGAFGIALIISIILVGFTHWTGYEIYKNGILKKIRTYFQNDKIEERKSLTPNNDIDISETTFADKDEKIYIQLLNRVKDANANATSSWMISIITAIFVVVIAIGATYVRGQVLEKQLIEEKSMTQTNVYEQSLPTSLVQTQESADTKAFDEAQDSDRKGGWATFIVLAVLFIFIQLLGILFGMKWGFAGKKSEEAFNYIDGFDNKQDYIEYYKRKKESISRIAEQKLKLLQQRMNQRGTQISSSAEGMNLLITKDNRTFKEYVKIQSEEKKEQIPTESNNSSEKNNTNPAITTRENKIDTTKNEIELCRNPECKKPLKKGAKRCTCGLDVKTEKKCPKCNFVDDDIEAKFCPNCDEKVELV